VRKPRGEVHRDGDWHGAVHIWVVTTASGTSEVVLQQRSLTKDTWPGKLDVAIGGHVRAGEGLDETLREAEEELGLALSGDDLVRLGTRKVSGRSVGVHDSEVQQVFGVVVPTPLIALVLHPEEVDAVVRMSFVDARALLVDGVEVTAAARGRRETAERVVRLGVEDVVPVDDGYYAIVLDAIEAVCAGSTPAPFTLGR
jgi:isopentenyldiphosphate isomerase